MRELGIALRGPPEPCGTYAEAVQTGNLLFLKEMVSMGGMTHDEPEGIGVKPEETKELTYTFAEAGETLAGCHVAGHYAGGMKAPITVSG